MRILNYISNKENITVKSVLKNEFNMTSSVITALKNSNGIILNNEIVTVRKNMMKGDVLKLLIPDTASDNIVKTPGYIKVLYEDEDVLCVNKPSGMPIHPSQNHYTDTLANYVCWYYRDTPFTFRVSNRLDRYTSGIVIIAKNIYSASFLCTEGFRKNMSKTYYAVCRGKLTKREGDIIAPIGRYEESTIKRCVTPDGKFAETHYELIREIGNDSMVKFVLKTGRTHQIRVHMAHIGHPLLNDFLYDENADKSKNFILHCNSISFIHPCSKKLITIESPLDHDILK